MGAASCGCAHGQEEVFQAHERPVINVTAPDSEEKVLWSQASKMKGDGQATVGLESILNVDHDTLSTQDGEVSRSLGMSSFEESLGLREKQVSPTCNSVAEEKCPRDMAEEEVQRVRKAIQEEETQLSSESWRDVSKQSAKILFKCKQKPASDCMRIVLESESQVKELPMLETKDGKILRGAIPTTMAVPHYPQWFPFCDSSTVLEQFSPSRFMVHCKLKILFVCLDFVVLINFQDKLQTEQECIEITISSPPPGSEGGEWLGVQLPQKPGSLPRISVRHGLMRLRPAGRQSVHMEWQMEVDDVSGAPQWIKVFGIQQVAVRLLPEVAKMQKNFSGSVIDSYLNGKGENCISEENLKFIFDVDRSFTHYVEHGRACGENADGKAV